MTDLLPTPPAPRPLPPVLIQHIDATITKFWPPIAPSVMKPKLREFAVNLATAVYNMGWNDADAAREAQEHRNSDKVA